MKRRTVMGRDCLRSYMCTTNLKNIFIYPDWENPLCDSYIACANGSLLLSSCRFDGYDYYNAARLSCEEFAFTTNICVFRMATELSS